MSKKHLVRTTVLAKIKKSADLETHLRLVKVEGTEVVEFRDFIPSLEEYGRGYWIDAQNPSSITTIIEAMTEVLARGSVG
jgi:predicted RNA-binding protein YlxR (DUF448 family)